VFLRRLVYACAIALAPSALLFGCSSGHGSLPLTQTQSASQSAASSTAKSLSAFPAQIDAIPVEISALPVQINGWPVQVSAYAVAACPPAPSGTASCRTQYRSDITPNPDENPGSIPGYHPSDLQNAYGLTGASASAGSNQTVAAIVAYASWSFGFVHDLNVYRSAFGLSSCTTRNGCIKFAGPTSFRARPGGSEKAWAIEAILGAEMISAICPNCHILMVGAASSNIGDLGAAVQTAVKNGATVIANSFSAQEGTDDAPYVNDWNTPGIPEIAGAGDAGYGPGFPATAPTVIAVGGTSMIDNHGTWMSKAWVGTGSGCSVFAPKPSWQHDTGCANRTVNDIAAVADPATGVAGYVTLIGGWTVFGGTSVSAQIIASMYALAGNGSSINDASSLYANASSFAPVIASPNGVCSIAYLCDDVGVGAGYTGPSGLGTPVGLAGF
jgi:subtilase family serine protease